ncbi:hypothetical protein TNCV_759591 [Trichonephila clavipes]|nr:hypothetical protein TNCV_759591 [Trichonephila clavipes]
MLKSVNGYNLRVQDINRKFPGTVNKMAGNYIKIQPATPDDHRDIATHLENIRAEHYIIKRLADSSFSLRICTAFPKIKPKKGEAQNNNNKPKNAQNKIIPATRPVEANISFANVCSGKVNQQMATPGEITALKSQESPRLTTQSEGASPTNESNVNFGSFAIYIAELQNITAKFPDIFQALEDMSKETNDINKLNIFLTGVARSFNKAQK